MKLTLLLLVCTPFLAFAMTPDEGLQRLLKGNTRYVEGAAIAPGRDMQRRLDTYEKQKPFAVIVTCSDSRVGPEILFDQGVGDLFVVRDAGNVIGATERESVEYSVGHLNSVVVLVMGHENCGAVSAVLDGHIKGIQAIAKLIEPSVKKAEKEGSKDMLLHAIKLNAIYQKNLLMQSPLLKKRVKEGTLMVRAAYFDLDDGTVELLE